MEYLKEACEYLLSLDDNTLYLLGEVIRYPYTTQSEIARRNGVTRQRINTALLYACRNHPELTSVFQLLTTSRTIKHNRYRKPTKANRKQRVFKAVNG